MLTLLPYCEVAGIIALPETVLISEITFLLSSYTCFLKEHHMNWENWSAFWYSKLKGTIWSKVVVFRIIGNVKRRIFCFSEILQKSKPSIFCYDPAIIWLASMEIKSDYSCVSLYLWLSTSCSFQYFSEKLFPFVG